MNQTTPKPATLAESLPFRIFPFRQDASAPMRTAIVKRSGVVLAMFHLREMGITCGA